MPALPPHARPQPLCAGKLLVRRRVLKEMSLNTSRGDVQANRVALEALKDWLCLDAQGVVLVHTDANPANPADSVLRGTGV